MTKKRTTALDAALSPTPTQAANGSDASTSLSTSAGQVAEQPAVYKAGNGENGGARTKVLASGAIYDLDAKRIVGKAHDNPYAITQTNANEYHEMSRQKRLEAVYRGLAAGTKRSNAHDAVEAIVACQSELAMDIDRGRASTEAARFAFQAGELIQDRRLDASGGVTVTAHVGADALASLLAMLDGRREDVIDGQMVDVDDGLTSPQ